MLADALEALALIAVSLLGQPVADGFRNAELLSERTRYKDVVELAVSSAGCRSQSCRNRSASIAPFPAADGPRWVGRLGEAHHKGLLHDELVRLGRTPLLIIDEVGYIPFETEAANLFFQLVSSRYERASVIVTSNKPFGRWGEVSGMRRLPPR